MKPRLSRLELKLMDALWSRGEASIRDLQESFPEASRPAYTTVQTMVYRLEAKKVVRRMRKEGNSHVFAASISRESAQKRVLDDLLAFFGGKSQPVMAHLIESGKLTLDDVRQAEKILRAHSDKNTAKKG